MPEPKATISQPLGPKVVPGIAPPLKTLDTTQTAPIAYAYTPEDVEAQENIQKYSPKDRIPADTIIYIRNNFPALVRFTDGYKSDGSFNLLLAAAGQEDSVKSIETFGILRNPGFQRWWKAGKVTVSNDNNLLPLDLDTSKIEIERLQQISLDGTVTFERTAPGSLPVSKDVDFEFLDEQLPPEKSARRGR
jgi:hypothetical protein